MLEQKILELTPEDTADLEARRKRIERDEFIDVRVLFDAICNRFREELAKYLARQSCPK
jgi:hypothetical protein